MVRPLSHRLDWSPPGQVPRLNPKPPGDVRSSFRWSSCGLGIYRAAFAAADMVGRVEGFGIYKGAVRVPLGISGESSGCYQRLSSFRVQPLTLFIKVYS